MEIVKVCVGSSCYIKGAYDVIMEFKRLIDENNLQNDIELKASFCQGNCMDAPCVEAGSTHASKVTTAQVENLLRTMGYSV